jgi:hypothetical protein
VRGFCESALPSLLVAAVRVVAFARPVAVAVAAAAAAVEFVLPKHMQRAKHTGTTHTAATNPKWIPLIVCLVRVVLTRLWFKIREGPFQTFILEKCGKRSGLPLILVKHDQPEGGGGGAQLPQSQDATPRRRGKGRARRRRANRAEHTLLVVTQTFSHGPGRLALCRTCHSS